MLDRSHCNAQQASLGIDKDDNKFKNCEKEVLKVEINQQLLAN